MRIKKRLKTWPVEEHTTQHICVRLDYSLHIEETSQRWRGVDGTVSDLTSLRIEPISMCLITERTGRLKLFEMPMFSAWMGAATPYTRGIINT